MKKIFILAIFATLLVSCNNGQKSNKKQKQATQSEMAAVQYTGVYKGTLPTASGSGMEVTIVLSDSTYTKTVSYIGREGDPVETNGKYTVSDHIITLEGEEAPNQYLIEENNLIHLDIDGQRITGDLADQYILHKE